MFTTKTEKELILEYNSKEHGFNSDSGGGIQKNVYQYNTETGKLVYKYDLSSFCSSVNKVCKAFIGLII